MTRHTGIRQTLARLPIVAQEFQLRIIEESTMRVFISLLASLMLFGCKPAEKTTESPKARFEPQSTETSKAPETSPAKALVTPEERQREYTTLENELGALEREVSALQIRATTVKKDVALSEEIAALSAKIATVRNELVTGQQLDNAAWPNRRESLTAELSRYRAELDTAARTLGP